METEKFKNRWTEHVDELKRLKWNLSRDDHDRVDELVDEFYELVETATENHGGGQ